MEPCEVLMGQIPSIASANPGTRRPPTNRSKSDRKYTKRKIFTCRRQRKTAFKRTSVDIAKIARCIKLTNEKRYNESTLNEMLAESSAEERSPGDGVTSSQKRFRRWPPTTPVSSRSPARPIKNWTTSNKVVEQEPYVSKTTPEFAEFFQLLEKRNLKSRDGNKLASREKKRPNDTKKSVGSRKKITKNKHERPTSSSKNRDQENIIYNEEDRQNRLKKSYFVKSNELPYQNAAGFAKLMKELKDKFNNKPPQENALNKSIKSASPDQTSKDKIESARKKLYSMLDRKPHFEQMVQNVSKQHVRIFSSCEVMESEKNQKIEDNAKKRCKSDTTSFAKGVPQLSKTTNEKEIEVNKTSAQKRFRSTNKIDPTPLVANPDEKDSENKACPQRRFRSSNGNSRIYFYKSTAPIVEENSFRSAISCSLDPSKFRAFLNKMEPSSKRSIDSIKVALKDGPKTTWVQDENKSWKKITAN